MSSAARLLAAWVAVTLITVSTVARAQSAAQPAEVRLTPAESGQERELQLRLDDIDSERAGARTSTVVPWTVVALGIAAMVVGLSIGLERVASCEMESCTSPWWPGWLVAGGAGISTGGLIWLRLARENIAELDSRRYHLQQQLDAYEVLREARASQRGLLHVRAAF
jgi:hypothetical protein